MVGAVTLGGICLMSGKYVAIILYYIFMILVYNLIFLFRLICFGSSMVPPFTEAGDVVGWQTEGGAMIMELLKGLWPLKVGPLL